MKLENLLGSDFKTNIGSPQGDGASALFFITYLAKSLKKLLKKDDDDIISVVQGLLDLDPKTVQEQLEITNDLQKVSEKNEKPPLPHHLEDHTYSNYEDTSFTVDQQYADDIGWASTAEHIIENIEKKTLQKNSKKETYS